MEAISMEEYLNKRKEKKEKEKSHQDKESGADTDPILFFSLAWNKIDKSIVWDKSPRKETDSASTGTPRRMHCFAYGL